MAYSTFGLVRALHVLTAGLAFGALAVLPLIRPRLQGAEDVRITREGLSFLRAAERWVIVPASLLLVVFGLAMVEGPLGRFSFTADGAGWLHLGTTLWMVLAFAVAGMIVARRKLVDEAREGATGGRTVARLWRWWTLAALTGALSVAAGVAVMGMRLGG